MERTHPVETEPRSGPRPASSAVPSVEELIRMHRELDTRLVELGRRRSLSPQEQFELAVMKKRKLALQDRIAILSTSS